MFNSRIINQVMCSLNTRSMLRTALLFSLFLSLAGCGFHLRGNIPLNEGIKNMFVIAPQGTFKDQLEEVLSGAGARLAANKAGADVVLDVRQADLRRTVGTLDERGKVSSYSLRFFVNYGLAGADGEVIRETTKLSETRRYNFNPEQVVESEAEEAELLSSMEQDVALRIVRQLAAITEYQPK